MATAATVYMATLGPSGLREVAQRCYQNAHYLATRLDELSGFELAFKAPFFHEFVVRTPRPVREINARLAERGIVGGFDLGQLDASLDHSWLLCATELNGRTSIDRFIEDVRRES
jgi:glycine dehydrogenase subunit 1